MKLLLRFETVSCRYDRVVKDAPALDRVSMKVGTGEFVAVMGATGSGKSTLLNCAAGLQRPTEGRVWLLDREVSAMGERALSILRRDHVGFVFQSYNLLTGLTVEQNILLPRRLGAARGRPLNGVLVAVGLKGFASPSVATLSGGERQRVAIARALVTEPDVIFADEPTGALDPTTGGAVLRLLRAAVDDGVTVLMVSHDPLAAHATDRLMLLCQGRLVDDRPTPDPATIASLLASVSDARSITAI